LAVIDVDWEELALSPLVRHGVIAGCARSDGQYKLGGYCCIKAKGVLAMQKWRATPVEHPQNR
jgi:hypothetical protein